MDPSALIMIGACLALVDEIGKAITMEQKHQSHNNKERELALSGAECKELHGTITCTKTTLASLSSLPFSTSARSTTPPPSPILSSSHCLSSSSPAGPSELTLQSCISGIQTTLTTLHKIITQHDTSNKNKFKVFNARRLKMFQLDFSLRLKADQIAALYLNDKLDCIIADTEGKEFWDKCFGQALFVAWDSFLHNFQTYLNLTVKQEDILKRTLDFAEDNFVSMYEFSLFLKWFGPFTGCYTRFLDSFDSGILCGFVPGMEANMLLDGKPPGYYVVRFSKTQPGSLAVTFVDDGTQTKHCLLHSTAQGLTLKSPPTVYKGISDFVAAHKSKLKFPITYQERATLNQNSFSRAIVQKELAYALPPASTHPSQTQLKEASKTSDKNLCVVCLDSLPNTVFLECSHMACCSVCAKSLPACPVCRTKITRVITIFRP